MTATAPDSTTTTTTTTAAAAAPRAAKPVPRWALHRRLYDWVLHFAHHPHATTALFVIAFAESSFFPIPPDVLLAPLCLGRRSKAMWFASICTLGSVLGAFLGYTIGYAAVGLVTLIPFISMGPAGDTSWTTINGLHNAFNAYGTWFVFIAALTPIPFKLLTITAGFARMALLRFTLACVVGRAMRFFAVAGVFWWIGPKAAPLIDKYFNWLTLAFVVLLVGGFAVIKLLH